MTSIRNDYVWTPEAKRLVESGAMVEPMRENDFRTPSIFDKKISQEELDAFLQSQKVKQSERTTEEKQAIIKKARVKSSGWSMLFGGLTTIACALRSDKKIAKKFDLDPEADKELIQNIRKNQVKASIPGLLGVGGIGFLCNLCKKPEKIEV